MPPPPLPLSEKATKTAEKKPKTAYEINNDLPEIVKKSIEYREIGGMTLNLTNKIKYTDYYDLGKFKVFKFYFCPLNQKLTLYVLKIDLKKKINQKILFVFFMENHLYFKTICLSKPIVTVFKPIKIKIKKI